MVEAPWSTPTSRCYYNPEALNLIQIPRPAGNPEGLHWAYRAYLAQRWITQFALYYRLERWGA